jgi:hypothetical protein
METSRWARLTGYKKWDADARTDDFLRVPVWEKRKQRDNGP